MANGVPGGPWVVDAGRLDSLLQILEKAGFQVLGPTVRDQAIVYDGLASTADLPVGWTDEQEGGRYRMKPRTDGAFFGYTVGPHSWKRFLHPPLTRLCRAGRSESGLRVDATQDEPPRYAFFGVRPCELAAIAIQDRVFLGGEHVDPVYKARRERVFLVAVNCGQAGGTCFCASMGTGPKASHGFDLALTEVIDEGNHHFVVEAGSERGTAIATELAPRSATKDELAAAERVVERTAERMGRRLDTEGLPELLTRNLLHPRWDEIAQRCLACTNCTMVCPTCFCTSVEDVSSLAGQEAERWRRWDSCFSADFSYVHGGSVRQSVKSRYRQWMTHKLATWHEQFGSSGCVGCGRCITWCPVGIDITEEAAAFRAADAASEPAAGASP
jgi:ferredoxin